MPRLLRAALQNLLGRAWCGHARPTTTLGSGKIWCGQILPLQRIKQIFQRTEN